jgi:hypothetical protein
MLTAGTLRPDNFRGVKSFSANRIRANLTTRIFSPSSSSSPFFFENLSTTQIESEIINIWNTLRKEMGQFTRHAAQGKEEEKPVGHDTSGTIRHDTVYCLGNLNFKSFPVQEKVFTSPVGIIRLLFFLYFKTKLRRWSIFLHHSHSRHYESFPCTVRPVGGVVGAKRKEPGRVWQ